MSQGCHIWILGFYRKVSIIFFSIVFCLQLIGLTATVLFRRRRCRSDSVSSLSLSAQLVCSAFQEAQQGFGAGDAVSARQAGRQRSPARLRE